ncbi:UNVERIFIED_ORG: hypothetical protein GGD59_005510 [Rhizobium esperanzae]
MADVVSCDPEVARADGFEAGNHPQQGRFPASRRPDQHDHFAVGNAEIDPLYRGNRAVILLQVDEFDRCHGILLRRRHTFVTRY